MIKEAIAQLANQQDLSRDLARLVMTEIMTGSATPVQIAAFLLALRTKGETVEEITACAQAMREHVSRIKSTGAVLDTCGTGADNSNSFNISTISALVAAAAGVKVAKHGNKAVSSKCGSADLLVELGVKIDLPVEKIEQCLEEIGFGFLYAPLLHPAMKYAQPVRREIGARTIFNILGPLTNPAGAKRQLLGVYAAGLTETLAKVLQNLGSDHVLIVHGDDGLDEVTVTAQTRVSELKQGKIRTYKIKPSQFGIKPQKAEFLQGKDPAFNAKIAYEILRGQGDQRRDIVLLNAGCAIYAADGAATIKEGIIKAAGAIDSGKALEKLKLLQEFTNR